MNDKKLFSRADVYFLLIVFGFLTVIAIGAYMGAKSEHKKIHSVGMV